MRPDSAFITLEGVEGCGKSTQSHLLVRSLKQAGVEVNLTREPGGTDFAEQVRALVLSDAAGDLPPMAELFLYLGARAEHVARRIAPYLAAGTTVVCDRFSDATIAYQGHGRGLPLDKVTQAAAWAENTSPDLTLLFDLPVATSLARLSGRGGNNRFDREAEDFHQRVRDGYLALAKAHPERIVVIDADQPLEAVHADVVKIVGERLGLPALSIAREAEV
ncbi:MAG: dTMP kinase [Leptospirillia bacterium]